MMQGLYHYQRRKCTELYFRGQVCVCGGVLLCKMVLCRLVGEDGVSLLLLILW